MSSIARPVARSVSRSVLAGQGVDLGYLIRSMFANGKQGFFYDPNDLSTMWQDQAKLLPVTGEGQPVWHILDKSGNNNHAFATSSATRPILRKNATTGAYYLAFDGTDDFLVTSSIDFTATDKISLFAGVRKLSDAAAGTVFELGASVNSGSFLLQAPSGSLNNIFFRSSGTLNSDLVITNQISPKSLVISAKSQISTDYSMVRINSVQLASGTADQGTGNYGNLPLYIGRRGGIAPFNGHIYSLIGVGRLTTDSETAAIEKELAKRTGVTLNV